MYKRQISNGKNIGDPTEIALLEAYHNYCFNHDYDLKTKRRLELPFDSSRKLMSVASNNHLYTCLLYTSFINAYWE